MWGPIERNGLPQFPIYADLGVGIWQYTLGWHTVASRRPADPTNPADPAYTWPAEIDRAVMEGEKYGIEVSLAVIGAPGWANGGHDWPWAPRSPQDFADFVKAAARRYPAVRHWLIWIEPTKGQNFHPLVADRGRRLRTKRQLRGPRLYARMLDRSYVALKAVDPRNRVIGGNSFTTGTVAPLNWLRALRLPNGKAPRMDLYGHNPFTLREPDLDHPSLGGGYADFSDLDTLARWIDRLLPGSHPRRKLKIFISEMSLPTDHANHEFNFFLSRRAQADWITRMLKISRSWSRIYSFGYLGLYDDEPLPDGTQVERGLVQRDGTRKPAYDSFKNG
jgi:hypothetical protein